MFDTNWIPPVIDLSGKKPAKVKEQAKPAAKKPTIPARPKPPKYVEPKVSQDITTDPAWWAIRTVFLVQKQCCSTCGNISEHIAGEFVHFTNSTGAIRRVTGIAMPNLPITVDFDGLDTQFVLACPACLRLSHRV